MVGLIRCDEIMRPRTSMNFFGDFGDDLVVEISATFVAQMQVKIFEDERRQMTA